MVGVEVLDFDFPVTARHRVAVRTGDEALQRPALFQSLRRLPARGSRLPRETIAVQQWGASEWGNLLQWTTPHYAMASECTIFVGATVSSFRA